MVDYKWIITYFFRFKTEIDYILGTYDVEGYSDIEIIDLIAV